MRAQQDFAAASGNSNNPNSGFTTGWVSFWNRHVDFTPSGSSSSSGRSSYGGDGSSSSSSGSDDGFNLRDPAARRLAELATAATRAMRRWNMYQRICRPVKALTDGSSSSSRF